MNCLFVLFLLFLGSWGQTFNLTPSDDYEQFLTNQTFSGQTVRLASGTYSWSTFSTIQGNVIIEGDSSATTIFQSTRRMFTFTVGTTIALNSLSILNAPQGFRLVNNTLTMTDVVYSNVANTLGNNNGLFNLEYSTLTISNAQLLNNSGNLINLQTNSTLSLSQVTLGSVQINSQQNCYITLDQVVASASTIGGGSPFMSITNSALTATSISSSGTFIMRNVNAVNASITLSSTTPQTRLSNVSITGTPSSQFREESAISVNAGYAYLENCFISVTGNGLNVITTNQGNMATVIIRQSTFTQCQYGAIVAATGFAYLDIDSCYFFNNTARVRQGQNFGSGGVLMLDSGAAVIKNSIIANNSADTAGAFYLLNSQIEIGNCTFIGNTNKRSGQFVIQIATSMTVTLYDSTFIGNDQNEFFSSVGSSIFRMKNSYFDRLVSSSNSFCCGNNSTRNITGQYCGYPSCACQELTGCQCPFKLLPVVGFNVSSVNTTCEAPRQNTISTSTTDDSSSSTSTGTSSGTSSGSSSGSSSASTTRAASSTTSPSSSSPSSSASSSPAPAASSTTGNNSAATKNYFSLLVILVTVIALAL